MSSAVLPGGMESAASMYATREDFQVFFASEMADLFRLALCLTADSRRAERGLILAMRNCMNTTSVPREWMRIWARRQVIRYGVRLLRDTSREPAQKGNNEDPPYRVGRRKPVAEALAGFPELVVLDDFQRLVFVICDLEKYSTRSCAVLLNRYPRDVEDARNRAQARIRLKCRAQRLPEGLGRRTPFRDAPRDAEHGCGSLLEWA